MIPGDDQIQAVTTIGGMAMFSNVVPLRWLAPAGEPQIDQTFTPGWIGQPLPYTEVRGKVDIRVAFGVSVTTGTLDYYPVSNPDEVTVLATNVFAISGQVMIPEHLT